MYVIFACCVKYKKVQIINLNLLTVIIIHNKGTFVANDDFYQNFVDSFSIIKEVPIPLKEDIDLV